MISAGNLTMIGQLPANPKLNRRRAALVLSKIDEILSRDKAMDRERDARFLELGAFLCEVRSGQYWRLDNLTSFDEFLQKRFPESRRKAYYVMAIAECLQRIPEARLRAIGWSKGKELARIARHEGKDFDSAIWLHRAEAMKAEEFKREVSRQVKGRAVEARDIIYFSATKDQLTVIEQALENAARILGAGKSRGYCLEMICADFLEGASREAGSEGTLFMALVRLISALPVAQRSQLLDIVRNGLEPIQTEAATTEA